MYRNTKLYCDRGHGRWAGAGRRRAGGAGRAAGALVCGISSSGRERARGRGRTRRQQARRGARTAGGSARGLTCWRAAGRAGGRRAGERVAGTQARGRQARKRSGGRHAGARGAHGRGAAAGAGRTVWALGQLGARAPGLVFQPGFRLGDVFESPFEPGS